MIWFEDTCNAGIEVIEVEFFRNEFVKFWDCFKVESNNFECFYHVVDFVEVSFLEEELHEDVEQFLVRHKTDRALHKGGAVLYDLIWLHLAKNCPK